ncbi:MAG: LPS-assembly protein LptD [Proteobacteria bacterium]|nr:LPS-assembly protein LptD [Pseudomonadota bacterium]
MSSHRNRLHTRTRKAPATQSALLRPLAIGLAVLICILSTSLSFAVDSPPDLFSPDAPVELTADRLDFDRATRTYRAEGSVVIAQEGTTIRAERATLNTETNIAEASGNVEMIDEGGNSVKGSSVTFNTKEKSAVILGGSLFFKTVNVYITGDPISKIGPETYAADNLSYTTCDCAEGEAPDWSFTTTDATVTIGEFLTGRHSYFKVRTVPIAYTPFLRVPIKRKRQSGLLKPEPGFSSLRGAMLGTSFFWARSKNTDATFYLDLQSRRGTGKGVEYRYIRKRSSYGELYFYHFKEKDIERVRRFRAEDANLARPESAGDNRWQMQYTHTELLPKGFKLKADINIVSDDEYLLDFGTKNEAKSLESIESNIALSKSWNGYSLVAQLRLFDNLLLGDDSATFMRMPEVSFSSTGKRILDSPFYISFASSYIHFTRKSGYTGHRIDATPKLSLPLRPGGYFDFTTYITPRATLYAADSVASGWYFDRAMYETGFDTTTTFSRIYRPNRKRLNALKHTLRPKLSYIFIPDVDQSDLPKFDSIDAIASANRITYSLNSTLTGKFIGSDSGADTATYHEYLYFDISQSFDINEAQRGLLSPTDKRRPMSDITSEAILRPTAWSTVSTKNKYDVYDHWIENSDVELQLNGANSSSVHFTYRYVKDIARYLEANARLWINPTVGITYDKRFSLAENKSLEASYGITYKKQCWTANLIYVRRLEEKALYLNFDLLGIGKVAALSGKIQSE